ncbi:MAG: peptide deformylase [Gammaproteobacteria bacterium]|nr:MAG: peptide deformylase [Gammaproteobacteria bacterium]
MAVRQVLRMGHPVLARRAEPVPEVELGSPGLLDLVEDLWDTMRAYEGAGLAAPQIGVGLRVVVFAVEANPRYPEAEPVPATALVNPSWEPLGPEMEEAWEGCLSLPGLRGLVPRYRRIRYRGLDPRGRELVREVEGFHARVVQHELDHLDGILYPQRMRDLAAFGFEEELQRRWEEEARAEAEAEAGEPRAREAAPSR